jgi:hypothetical protein
MHRMQIAGAPHGHAHNSQYRGRLEAPSAGPGGARWALHGGGGARGILRDALADADEPDGLGSRIHARVMALTNGVDLAVPPRSAPRPPPDMDVGAP